MMVPANKNRIATGCRRHIMTYYSLFNMFCNLLGVAFLFLASSALGSGPEAGWDDLQPVLEQIKAPEFPDVTFSITDFGAVADEVTINTGAIGKAIAACSEAGGGRVVVPSGIFLTGPVHLKSNVNLHLEKGAVLKFSRHPEDYLPVVLTRWEGVDCYNYSPLVYVLDQVNVAITGEGTLDGNANASNWWPWKGKWGQRTRETGAEIQDHGRKRLMQMGADGTPVEERIFGTGHYLRPMFVQFYRCRNILIEGIAIINSPMWVIHPVLSENITIARVRVKSHGPNNDGCDPESSRNVLIRDSHFDTDDDCIAIKSGRGNDGRRVNLPSENIVVQRCTMRDGHGGVVLGSEISGSVRNVFVEDCAMNSPYLDRVLRIKTNSNRGGILENIFMRNIDVGNVKQAVLHIDYHYDEGDSGPFTPVVRNIHMDRVTSRHSDRVIFINAYERSPVSGVYISNSTFNGVKRESRINHAENIRFQNTTMNGKSL